MRAAEGKCLSFNKNRLQPLVDCFYNFEWTDLVGVKEIEKVRKKAREKAKKRQKIDLEVYFNENVNVIQAGCHNITINQSPPLV